VYLLGATDASRRLWAPGLGTITTTGEGSVLVKLARARVLKWTSGSRGQTRPLGVSASRVELCPVLARSDVLPRDLPPPQLKDVPVALHYPPTEVQ
jgi:hypothetical protein